MRQHKRAPLSEVWMEVKDHRMIAKLMVIQGISQRALAAKAGYKSHAYMGRILRGEVKTLDPDAAVRIAKHLGVGVDDLFLVRVSSDNGHSVHRRPA
jgi:transcriptional regulator with XRE-family HTH domain